MMEIKSAEFVISNTDVQQCPDGTRPEYAFIGRSNVGKSSLINMLTARKRLAMTSQKPGKTQLINHFIINGDWYIVDLPGYGYAQHGKANRENLRRIIESYILRRPQLTCLFVLLDCRHAPQKTLTPIVKKCSRPGKNCRISLPPHPKTGTDAKKSSIISTKLIGR